MSFVLTVDWNRVQTAIEAELTKLEEQTKKAPLADTPIQVAEKVYHELQAHMEQMAGLDPDIVKLQLQMIKNKFESPFGIAKELKQWAADHPASFQPAWSQLVFTKG